VTKGERGAAKGVERREGEVADGEVEWREEGEAAGVRARRRWLLRDGNRRLAAARGRGGLGLGGREEVVTAI
jgi:hypothetical protein